MIESPEYETVHLHIDTQQYVGQVASNPLADDAIAMAVASESKVHHSQLILTKLKRALGLYNSDLARYQRSIHQIEAQLALEYYRAGNWANAKHYFDAVYPTYQKEGWWDILTSLLLKLMDCNEKLADHTGYLTVGMELIAGSKFDLRFV